MATKVQRGFRIAGLAVVLLLCAACQQRMAMQPSYKPLDPSSFFPDGRSARPVVPGTIARGHLHTDTHLFTGKRRQGAPNWALPVALIGMATTPLPVPGAAGLTETRYENDVDTVPFPITHEVLEQGYNRYMIYCVVCHDPL
ncbi:MAG: hypothetical protein JO112_08150, partial [Planctomycetes bacterium]|nr:hypothetical protein [Planctomycetota bacterium]